MGRMWASEVLLLLLLGSSRAVTPGLDVSTAPGLDGSIPPGLDGSIPPGLDGSVSPGLDGSVSPGLDGSVSPGLDGSASPGLDGSTPAGRDGTITPKLEGTITPKQDGSISPSWPWRWPITYLDAILAAVRLLNQRISGPCILRLREAQPRPGWVGTLQRRREVSFLVEDGPCPPGVDCRSCEPGALQHCVGTVSIEQQPTAELRCRPLRPQPIRNWWIRIWEWLNGIRKRLRQRSPFYVRGHLNVTSTPQP
ncbi:cathelicidin-B1 precursor [Gallus gallus]|uniref:Cathelicidin B1 n=1 Tax=Gallus gallus TaxID=9031 RepID=R4GJF1_CHICK|nr:cathelicidin-B1 precursor [Gallus gallus]|eukprot:NP_001258101.1 cathelicidin-B1 precursor [Gallus gallus]